MTPSLLYANRSAVRTAPVADLQATGASALGFPGRYRVDASM